MLILCVCTLFCVHSRAVVTMSDLPYFCGFEQASDYSDWTLDITPKTNNHWIVGTASAYDGTHSLYISADNSTPTYQPNANITIAFFQVELTSGNYDFAFDWKSSGTKNTGSLRIFLTNHSVDDIHSLSGNAEPNWFTDNKAKQLTGEQTPLTESLSDGWQHIQASFTLNKSYASEDMYIVFAWENSVATPSNNESFQLDNVQLAKSSTAGYPADAHVDYVSGVTNIYWESTTADQYEIRLKSLLDNNAEWMDFTSPNTMLSLNDIDFGVYEMWIRTQTAQDKSVYTYITPFYIYETDCFDALNMYGATFETGTWRFASGNVEKHDVDNKKIDYGYLSSYSRQTTHFDKDELDARTIGTKDDNGNPIALHTVPESSFGSVRLGNWNTGSQYENITFKYTVTSRQYSILLLKYAMVLQDIDHPASEQPRVAIDILDENGNSVDVKCGTVDFHTPTPAERTDIDYVKLWHYNSAQSCWWQDWRAVGLNLENLLGQTLTVTLTSYDCDQSGHYGYFYFTLNCISSEMDGIPWGEDASTTYFSAPEGFDYKWYNKENYFESDGVTPRSDDDPQKKEINNTPPTLPYVGPQNKLTVDQNDPADYIVEVIYPTNSECNYIMEATARPHTPKAEIQWEWVPKDCQNAIVVKNASHVVLTDRVTGETEDRYDMQLPIAQWILPDGSTTQELNFEGWHIPCSNDGEQLKYYLRASIFVHDKEWADSVELIIDVPPIGPIDSLLYDTICEGDTYYWKNIDRKYTITNHNDSTFEFLYTDEKAWTGCDSTVHMMLFVNATRYVTVYDTICDGNFYIFGEGSDATPYNKTTTTTKLFHSQLTGCDSVVTLNLFKLPVFAAQPQAEIICADGDFIDIAVSDAQYVDKYEVIVPQKENHPYIGRQPNMVLQYPLQELNPDHYEAVVRVYTPFCEPQEVPISFNVNFASSTIKLKWDNVLAILNEKYNGGYEFSSYQWYKNNVAIQGATGSWYHTDNSLEEAEYSVDVTLKDGTELKICPLMYKAISEEDNQSARKIIENGNIYILNGEEKYNLLGVKIK